MSFQQVAALPREGFGAARRPCGLAKGDLRRVLLSVPLEQLNLKAESFRFASPGAHKPQING